VQKIINGIKPAARDILNGIFIREQSLRDRFEREQSYEAEGICNPLHRDSVLTKINLELNGENSDNNDLKYGKDNLKDIDNI
jgi:hypothetical protein